MVYVLCAATFVLYTLQAFADKLSSKITANTKSVLLFGVIKCGFGAIFAALFLLITRQSIAFYRHTLWISVMSGIGQGVCTYLIIATLKRSSLIQVNMFMSAGVLVPTILSAVFFGEALNFIKIAAIFLFLIAAALLLGVKSVKDFSVNKTTFLLLFALGVFFGIIMFGQKSYPKLVPSGSVALFSLLMYSTSTLFLAICMLFTKKSEEESISIKTVVNKKFIIIGILCAIIVFSLNQVITLLSGLLPAALVFPLTNGAKLVIVAIVAILVFKEKPQISVFIGMLFMTGAIYMLSI